jgi:DNA-binding LytR/AlgR family response regulator
MDFSRQSGKKILIVEKTKRSYVNMEDITHISCDRYVSIIHLVDGTKKDSTAQQFNEFEKKLEKYGFWRLNRKTLANGKHFSEDQTVNRKKHIMVYNTDILVSRRKSSQLENKLKECDE